MKLASYEEFIEKYKKTSNEEKRTKAKERFCYTAVVKACYPDHDDICTWCWDRFGSPECEECYDYQSENPGCPLVLATETKRKFTYKDSDGEMKEEEEKIYKNPGKHSHNGTWTTVWLGKTGYDYGYTEYHFQNKKDRDLFVKEFPFKEEECDED